MALSLVEINLARRAQPEPRPLHAAPAPRRTRGCAGLTRCVHVLLAAASKETIATCFPLIAGTIMQCVQLLLLSLTIEVQCRHVIHHVGWTSHHALA